MATTHGCLDLNLAWFLCCQIVVVICLRLSHTPPFPADPCSSCNVSFLLFSLCAHVCLCPHAWGRVRICLHFPNTPAATLQSRGFFAVLDWQLLANHKSPHITAAPSLLQAVHVGHREQLVDVEADTLHRTVLLDLCMSSQRPYVWSTTRSTYTHALQILAIQIEARSPWRKRPSNPSRSQAMQTQVGEAEPKWLCDCHPHQTRPAGPIHLGNTHT